MSITLKPMLLLILRVTTIYHALYAANSQKGVSNSVSIKQSYPAQAITVKQYENQN